MMAEDVAPTSEEKRRAKGMTCSVMTLVNKVCAEVRGRRG